MRGNSFCVGYFTHIRHNVFEKIYCDQTRYDNFGVNSYNKYAEQFRRVKLHTLISFVPFGAKSSRFYLKPDNLNHLLRNKPAPVTAGIQRSVFVDRIHKALKVKSKPKNYFSSSKLHYEKLTIYQSKLQVTVPVHDRQLKSAFLFFPPFSKLMLAYISLDFIQQPKSQVCLLDLARFFLFRR